jgi:hypothetical protein
MECSWLYGEIDESVLHRAEYLKTIISSIWMKPNVPAGGLSDNS